MPVSAVVSPSFPVYDREVIWPNPPLLAPSSLPRNFPVPTPFQRDTNPTFATVNTTVTIQGANQGGSLHRLNSPNIEPGQPAQAQSKANAAARGAWGFEGLAVTPYIDVSRLPAGWVAPSIERVYWMRFEFQITDPAMTAIGPSTRLLLVPFNDSAGGIPNSPTNAVGADNTGGFGIHGNAAGTQWEYVSYNRAGINLVRETQPLPAHSIAVGDLNQFDALLINGRPGTPPSWEFYWNSQLVLTRNYLGTLLEPTVGANKEWAYAPMLELNALALAFPQVLFYRFWVRWGRFLPNGQEIQG